jgi:hypothetical protein
MIIAAYAGTGKTSLANNHPNEFVDFACMPYKYVLSPYSNLEESGKANFNNIMRDEWPYNYVDAILAEKDCGKHLLIPTDLSTLMILRYKEVPYILCYPEREAKEEYRRRFVKRGNSADFIAVFIDMWDYFLEAFEKDDYGKLVVLKQDDYLEKIHDILNRGHP